MASREAKKYSGLNRKRGFKSLFSKTGVFISLILNGKKKIKNERLKTKAEVQSLAKPPFSRSIR